MKGPLAKLRGCAARAVVPANAGTHSAGSIRFRDVADALKTSEADGYGPLLSQGRQRVSTRPCQRAIDHRDRIGKPIDRDKGAETRALLLPEQHLIKHVEPVERHARTAVLALLDRV